MFRFVFLANGFWELFFRNLTLGNQIELQEMKLDFRYGFSELVLELVFRNGKSLTWVRSQTVGRRQTQGSSCSREKIGPGQTHRGGTSTQDQNANQPSRKHLWNLLEVAFKILT